MRRLQWRDAAFAIQATNTEDGADAKGHNKLYGYETNVQACFRLRNEGGSMPHTACHVHRLLETRSYSVWRRCFTFFETVEDGRVHSCFKKKSRLAKRNNCAFPGGSLIRASVWRTCFTFFETVKDGRVHSCLKKDRALPGKTKTPRLPYAAGELWKYFGNH